MDTFLLIGYLFLLGWMIVDFVNCLRKKAKFSVLLGIEVIALIGAAVVMNYYQHLPIPDNNLMAGVQYIGEIIFSFGAMCAYGFMLGLTAITRLVLYILEKK